ncbi:MAG: hypothetical protein Q9223_003936 [Gallowayella weberi]
MLDNLNYNNPIVARRYWLFCGDDWVQWKDPTDEDELDTQIPKRKVGAVHAGGSFLVKAYTPMTSLVGYLDIRNAPHQPNPMCRQPGVTASTFRRVRATTFCDLAFDPQYKTLQETKIQIQPGDRLDRKITLAHLWIHEWGHLLNQFEDEPAVDSSGHPIAGDANGWERAVNLARFEVDRARGAPDLYALFATAVFFDNYGWGSGVAETD